MNKKSIISIVAFAITTSVTAQNPASLKKFWNEVSTRYKYNLMTTGAKAYLFEIANEKTKSYTTSIALLENIQNETSFQDYLFLRVYVANYQSKESLRMVLGTICGSFSISNLVADWVFEKYSKDPRAIQKIKINKQLAEEQKSIEFAKEIEEQIKREKENKKIAQEKREKEIADSMQEIAYKRGESIIPAMPINGLSSLGKLISENFNIPDTALKSPLKGRVNILVQFTVDTTGNVVDAKTISETLGYGLEEEAIRVIKLSKWTPAKDKETGLSVKVILKQNIALRINDNDEY